MKARPVLTKAQCRQQTVQTVDDRLSPDRAFETALTLW